MPSSIHEVFVLYHWKGIGGEWWLTVNVRRVVNTARCVQFIYCWRSAFIDGDANAKPLCDGEIPCVGFVVVDLVAEINIDMCFSLGLIGLSSADASFVCVCECVVNANWFVELYFGALASRCVIKCRLRHRWGAFYRTKRQGYRIGWIVYFRAKHLNTVHWGMNGLIWSCEVIGHKEQVVILWIWYIRVNGYCCIC